MVEPGSRHNQLFCGCVETEQFVPVFQHIYDKLNHPEDNIINHQELSELMSGSMAAYLLLTVLEATGVLEHGSSIRNCWAQGQWVKGEYVRNIEPVKALILECQAKRCPYCKSHQLDVEYDAECKAHYWCQECEQTIKDNGEK